MASRTVSKDVITLKGSSAIVSEFFGYAANSILYNRGVYPEESFVKVRKYGLPMLLTQDEGVKSYIASITSQLSEWLEAGKMQRVVLVIMSKTTSEVLERWNFNIETDAEVIEKGVIKEKSDKEIMREIQAIMRQIASSITYLPCFDESCIFDVLAYTDRDVAVPFTLIESDARLINNPQMVKQHSFDTKIHKVDTLVSYKVDEWDERAGKSSSTWSLHEDRINTVDFNPGNSNLMATSSTDGTTCIWDLRCMRKRQREQLKKIQHKSGVHSAYFSPTGSYLATTSLDDRVGILGASHLNNISMVHHNNCTSRWLSSFRAIWGWDDSFVFLGNMTRAVDIISTFSKTTIALESPWMTSIPCRFAAHRSKFHAPWSAMTRLFSDAKSVSWSQLTYACISVLCIPDSIFVKHTRSTAYTAINHCIYTSSANPASFFPNAPNKHRGPHGPHIRVSPSFQSAPASSPARRATRTP